MERNLKSLIGNSIEATDGEIGTVQGLYFDDKSWAIRFLVVQTGSWLMERSVLISPVAFKNIDANESIISVNLTKDQVSNSPDTDTHKTVSRQQETELYEHYSWQPYWGSGFYAGGLWGIMPRTPLFDKRITEDSTEDNKNTAIKNNDLHLRSSAQITGYYIQANDGEVGHVNDFIIDDKSWKILYFIIDTHNWIGGKKVLVEVKNIKDIQWENGKVILNITIEAVKDSRLFEESEFSFS